MDAATLINQFTFDFNHQYSPLEITDSIIQHAMALADHYSLKGYDAVQLSVALAVNSEGLELGLPALTIISADEELNAAADREGLIVDNPNNH